MANDLNNCTFIGRLAADPEIRYAPSGDQIASIRIAVGWKTKDKEGAEWIPVTAFGKLAEIFGQYLKKGMQVYISGRWKTDTYEKNGEKRYSTRIIADRMQMLGSRQDGGGNTQSNYGNTQSNGGYTQSGGYQQSESYTSDFDDDIPF